MTERVARVVVDVTGLDKVFDYVVPADFEHEVRVGTVVRVELHGRRVRGWVRELLDVGDAAVEADALKPIAKVTGHGPAAELFELAEWAATRWAARRSRPFLVAATPPRVVRQIGMPRRGAPSGATSPATTSLLEAGGGVVRLPPRVDVLPAVLSAVAVGPTLVVAPTANVARRLAQRLRAAGATVALMPDGWAAAAAGVDAVVGTRSAAWAPCAGMRAAVVIDEHDEALQEERSPTWHARDVVVERCRRSGVPYVLTSPIPTLNAIENDAGSDAVVHPPRERERAGWPQVHVVDRRDEVPWKRSLVTSALIEQLRTPQRRVACVINIAGRARLMACRSCQSLIRCEHCDAAARLNVDHRVHCARCGRDRPQVCQVCGASDFANLRPGVSRLREELEAAAQRTVVEVNKATDDTPAHADLYVGTEAVLHRVHDLDVVAFLDFDSEMLAPRFRAAEHSMALIVRAGRLAPNVMIQTFEPDHEVIRAAVGADPQVVVDVERPRRKMLSLPPYAALARVSGTGAAEFVAAIEGSVEVGGNEETAFLVRSDDWMTLGAALNAAPRPDGARLRVEVDPARI